MRSILVHGLAFYELPDGSLFPVLAGGKGGAPAPAQPTPEERRLQGIQAQAAQEQLILAREQRADTEALTPLLLQEYGLNRVEKVSQADPRLAGLQAERATLAQQLAALPAVKRAGPRGTIVTLLNPEARAIQDRIKTMDSEIAGLDPGGRKSYTYEKTEDDMTKKRKEIEGMQLDRSLKALKGELPVTATLAKELELGKRTLAEKLSRQLGPGWETSSAGIQANAEYDRMATSLREAEQKDQLTTAEALSINRQASRAGNTEAVQNTSSIGRVGASGLLSTSGGSAGNALDYYGSLRGAAERAQQRGSDSTSGYVAGGMGLVGAGIVGGAILI